MEPLSLSTRGLLRKRSLCSSCLRRHLFQSRSFDRPSHNAPQDASPANSGVRARKLHQNGRDINQEPTQALPQGNYYLDMLLSPYPSSGGAVTSRKVGPPQQEQKEPLQKAPTPSSTTKPQSVQERMALVFGAPLSTVDNAGRSTRYRPSMTPESTWKTVNGVPIPPRPSEPDNCCMSGCVHCVWDDYRDDMEEWAARVEQAYTKAKAKSPEKDMRQARRPEVDSSSMSMDDDGGGSETNWELPASNDGDDLFAGIPVGIREFMKTQKMLREKHQKEKEAHAA